MVTIQAIHTLLERIEFPSTKEQIIDQMWRLGASEAVIARLQFLPEHRYGSVDSVLDALRGLE